MVDDKTSKRRYDGRLRAERARETRRRIVDAATELFRTQGYAATTIAQIAASADVSIGTVHANGPKPALIQAAVEVASFGVEGEHLILDVAVGKRLLTATDPEEFTMITARFTRDLNHRVAGLWLALDAAADIDPELAERRAGMMASIARTAYALVDLCAERGWLRGTDGRVSRADRAERAATVLVVSSPDSYRRCTRDLRLGREAYLRWLRRGFASALLD